MTADIRLPEKWSKGSAGGPEFRTLVSEEEDGVDYGEQIWLHPLQRYEIAHNIKTPEEIAQLRAFHYARRGRLVPFLFKDWLDSTSALNGLDPPTALDQPLGIGDGETTVFPLIKRYPDIVDPYDRPILWPVEGTLLIAIDGVEIVTGFSVERGEAASIAAPVEFETAPDEDAVITAGFRFDVPVKFQEDWLSITWDTINSRTAGSVPLREYRKRAA